MTTTTIRRPEPAIDLRSTYTRRSSHGQALMDATPLRCWIKAQTSAFAWRQYGPGELARLSGLQERAITRIESGEQRTVTLDLADRLTTLVTGSPETLHELYPLDPHEQLELAA